MFWCTDSVIWAGRCRPCAPFGRIENSGHAFYEAISIKIGVQYTLNVTMKDFVFEISRSKNDSKTYQVDRKVLGLDVGVDVGGHVVVVVVDMDHMVLGLVLELVLELVQMLLFGWIKMLFWK